MTFIAHRLKSAREAKGLTQRELSDRLGFKDRQTVAAIEAGLRKVGADELIQVMKILERDLEYFTDPYRLDGEGSFSWRAAPGLDQTALDAFEARAGGWIALYRKLAQDEGQIPRTHPLALNLTPRSSMEDAQHAAEWLGSEWQLGDAPARRLEDAIRTRYRALVLSVDAPAGISGAAFHLPELNAIFVNRGESAVRRNEYMAHALFSLLTWETITPPHAQQFHFDARGRAEQLATAFALALLIPERTVRNAFEAIDHNQDASWPRNDDEAMTTLTPQWLNARASELDVSTLAYQWRLVHLGLLTKDRVDQKLEKGTHEPRPRRLSVVMYELKGPTKEEKEGLKSERNKNWPTLGEDADRVAFKRPAHGVADALIHESASPTTPRAFNEEFVRVLHSALKEKHIAFDHVMKLLDLDQDEVAHLFRTYQLEVPS